MRQIALDTETTGIGHDSGHRIIEIGCIELIDRKITGRSFHTYLNPKRAVDPGAFRVHGIADHFLKDKPEFKTVSLEFLQFIDNAELVIHNPGQLEDTCSVIDTLVLARKKHPGQRNSLDALCKRYDVDNTNRQLHGALLDAEILAHVYLAMTGGQTDLFHEADPLVPKTEATVSTYPPLTSLSPIRYASPEELERHESFKKKFKITTL